ncbi:MAG TPA: N-acetyltransferase [bacterium]|nr:N-acetyltransferase [bacterium]
MAVTVKPIDPRNKKQREAFLHLPWKIYRTADGKKDPHWVPPFLDDQRSLLDPDKNPFWKHAKVALYAAYDEKGEIVGRISASVDDNFNQFWDAKVGFFGWFECINDPAVAQALFNEAAGFLKAEGMTVMRGPSSFTSNDDYFGFLLEGHDSPARIGMTYNPPYYLTLSEGSGLAKVKDLYAWYLSAQIDLPERIVKIAERTKQRERITIRPLNMKRLFEDAAILKDLYNKIWEKNWGFVPMTDEEFNYQVKKLKDVVWPDFVVFAEVDGKPIGFNLVVPDVNQLLIKMNGELFSKEAPFALFTFLFGLNKIDDTREMAMGVLPEYRKKGLEAILYLEALKTGKKRRIKGGELSWTLEDNEGINNGIEAMGGKIIKKYRLYEKAL